MVVPGTAAPLASFTTPKIVPVGICAPTTVTTDSTRIMQMARYFMIHPLIPFTLKFSIQNSHTTPTSPDAWHINTLSPAECQSDLGLAGDFMRTGAALIGSQIKGILIFSLRCEWDNPEIHTRQIAWDPLPDAPGTMIPSG